MSKISDGAHLIHFPPGACRNFSRDLATIQSDSWTNGTTTPIFSTNRMPDSSFLNTSL